MTITGGTALGKDEIDRMMKDAEAHAEEDKRLREEAEVRNTADSLVFQTEKLLKEQGEKVSADERTKIEDALKSLKDALSGVDIEAVKAAHEVLITASQEFAQRIYAAAQSTTGDDVPGATGSAPSDDEVADAEIVDDEKSA